MAVGPNEVKINVSLSSFILFIKAINLSYILNEFSAGQIILFIFLELWKRLFPIPERVFSPSMIKIFLLSQIFLNFVIYFLMIFLFFILVLNLVIPES